MRLRKGFTLIELIIVVSIISVLVALGTSIYASAQRSSRDGKRKTDLANIQAALEQYRSNNNSYPASLIIKPDCTSSNGAISDVSNTYMTVIPKDPYCQLYQYQYSAKDTGGSTCVAPTPCVDYTVSTYLESSRTGCSSPPNCSYSLTPPVSCNYCQGPNGPK